MVKTIRLRLEYNTYCLCLYDENGEIIDNDNPPEWEDDVELTNAFLAISDLYDTFFIDNEKEFRYTGCPDAETGNKLKALIAHAISVLEERNKGKYFIENDIHLDF